MVYVVNCLLKPFVTFTVSGVEQFLLHSSVRLDTHQNHSGAFVWCVYPPLSPYNMQHLLGHFYCVVSGSGETNCSIDGVYLFLKTGGVCKHYHLAAYTLLLTQFSGTCGAEVG